MTLLALLQRANPLPFTFPCDDGCGNQLTLKGERYSKRVRGRRTIVCPDCAKRRGWLDGE